MAGERDAPGHDVEAEVLCDGDALDDPVCGEFDDQDGDVDTGC